MENRIDYNKVRPCQSIFGFRLCVGDEVSITAGRASYYGKIRYLTGVAIVLQTSNSQKTVLVRVDKINTILLMNTDGNSNIESNKEDEENGEVVAEDGQSS